MIIAISVDEDKVSEHFGRCEKYYLYEVQDRYILKKTEVKNPGHKPFFLPNFLADKGVNVLITGGMGHRAIETFKKLNIKLVTGVRGNAEKVINDYLYGRIKENVEPCEKHSE